MRPFLFLFCLGLVTLTGASELIRSPYGVTSINGHITVGGYITSRNTFEDKDSTKPVDLNEIGILLRHDFNANFGASFYSTTDEFLDYGFLQARYLTASSSTGVRAGRIRMPSGAMLGAGPYSDYMNFLPQGTEPQRIRRPLFRLDGVQLFHEQDFGLGKGLVTEISYGEHVIDSEAGVYEMAVFYILEGDSLRVKLSKPSLLVNVNLYVDEFEFIVNYTDMEGELVGLYRNTLPLSLFTGNPNDATTFVDVEEEIRDDSYPSRIFKVAMAYSPARWEHILTLFHWRDTPGETRLGDVSLGSAYTSKGFSYLLRYMCTDRLVGYTGYSQYRGTFDNTAVTKALKTAPSYVDYGQSGLIGMYYQASQRLHVIAEMHYNKGAIFLNGEYQDPATVKKYWALYSLTANYVF